MFGRNFKLVILLSVVVFCIGLDQLTKAVVLKNISSQDVFVITPFLNFVLRWNMGISFGFLSNSTVITPTMLLWGNSFLISILLIMLLKSKEFWVQFGLALVVGGGIGNIIDRIYHGAVVDFINFHLNDWHFAVFNMGDAFVNIGMILCVVMTYLKERRVS